MSKKISQQASIKKDLETIKRQYTDRLKAYADSIRKNIVIPFCDKHNLRFVSISGGQEFISADETIEHDKGNVCYRRRSFWNKKRSIEAKMWNILWLPAYHRDLAEGHGDVIGKYCASYTSPGYTRELARLRKKANQAALEKKQPRSKSLPSER